MEDWSKTPVIVRRIKIYESAGELELVSEITPRQSDTVVSPSIVFSLDAKERKSVLEQLVALDWLVPSTPSNGLKGFVAPCGALLARPKGLY